MTPFNALINSSHRRWLDWLERLIELRLELDRKRVLLSNFLLEHPGAEHFGGVLRGGTFVVLAGETGDAVGDLMLPYIEEEQFDDYTDWPHLPPLPDDGSLWRLLHGLPAAQQIPRAGQAAVTVPASHPRLTELADKMGISLKRLEELKQKRARTGLS